MKLPNAQRAAIAKEKLADYLLDTEHVYGGSKAQLLHLMGYLNENWEQLASEIKREVQVREVVEVKSTAWGARYEIFIELQGTFATPVQFRSIWQIDLGTTDPRLITTYPE